MNLIQTPSPNFDDRRAGKKPAYIIMHYTGTKTAEEARDRFLDPAPNDKVGRIAPHYMINGDGSVLQFMPEEKRAWHAGVSFWRGETDLNSVSIGIEVWNPGHEFGYTDFLPAQIDAVIELCQGIMQRWDIPPENVLGHADIAPGRKIDPGEKFPWQTLSTHGVGVWPKISLQDKPFVTAELFKDLLVRYGYNPDIRAETLISAFAQHFWPEKYATLTPFDWPQLYQRLVALKV